jgi:hypothetical protein
MTDKNRTVKIDVGDMEGRAYVVGREGHIHINEPAVSRKHLEIKFVDGRIRLRDLGSTNGTYLITGDKKVNFQECYVKPRQPFMIGERRYTVRHLLAVLGIVTSYSENSGLSIRIVK